MLAKSAKISPHFSYGEFWSREQRRGEKVVPYPEDLISGRLAVLCSQLEKIRSACGGHSVTVLSGYRTPAYNVLVGGARESQHIEGRACDFVIDTKTPREVQAKVMAMIASGEISVGGIGFYKGFTHVDVRPSGMLAKFGDDVENWRTSQDDDGSGREIAALAPPMYGKKEVGFFAVVAEAMRKFWRVG
jgi:hypothetical protein